MSPTILLVIRLSLLLTCYKSGFGLQLLANFSTSARPKIKRPGSLSTSECKRWETGEESDCVIYIYI